MREATTSLGSVTTALLTCNCISLGTEFWLLNDLIVFQILDVLVFSLKFARSLCQDVRLTVLIVFRAFAFSALSNSKYVSLGYYLYLCSAALCKQIAVSHIEDHHAEYLCLTDFLCLGIVWELTEFNWKMNVFVLVSKLVDISVFNDSILHCSANLFQMT